MNDQPGNVVTQLFAWIAAVGSAAGIATQDLIFIFFGAVGAAVSVFSFISGRIDAYRERKEDERRTKMLSDYLSSKNPNPESTESVAELMKRISD
ncbi:hypothetical protein AO825_08310 [Pectobacterium brasiliense]|uniref:hypothetical protein n=1 Tax=Pectobacterium brasiliense TaxID=180957 RepID=UPI0001A444E9|nr:hypothetical protein [Pectobacterium brasiliense]KGA24916.1 hypothetical protein KS44_06285 [Pectobacterium brasiliense]KRF62853.1 hypothetical protein AO825_08310 [Pectobacterium brasiliense]MBN3186062.1 hypothetical protein [Pectobacterium brasiliense]QHG26894.1 hypothetical protein GT391_01850 [Pectobacterium brasiliense]